ncbi:MAG: BNR-repeat neuraminidase N-terminal domain-containing protein [Ignavibacteria bacterium]
MKKVFTFFVAFLTLTFFSVTGFMNGPINFGIGNSLESTNSGNMGPLAMVSESFDNVTFPPTGWTATILSGSYNWQRVTSGTSPTCLPHSGAGMATYQSYSATSGSAAILITPSFSLTSGQGQVNFWMYRDPGYPSNYDSISVWVNTTPSMTGATYLGGVWRYNATANWYYFSYSIPASFNGPTNYVIFHAYSAYGNNMYLDDVSYGVPEPMVYVSSTTTQNTNPVIRNSVNNQVIGIQVVTTGGLNPFTVTQFKLGTEGTPNPLVNIANAKLWYTGNSPVFATTTQFGSTVPSPNGAFNINGSQTLLEGTNYFWLTYDVPGTAILGDSIDARCDSIIATGSMGTKAPSPQNPPGSRKIVGPLSGTFVIGPGEVSPNYPNFTTAISDLTNRGVSGPVTFLVKPAVYGTDAGVEIDSVLTFGPVTGASNTNTITFKKKSDLTGEVWIERYGTTGTTDYIVQFLGAQYFTFDSINVRQKDTTNSNMVERGFWITNSSATQGAQYITIRNSKIFLKGTNTSTVGIYQYYNITPTLFSGTNSNNTFQNNLILNARIGIYLYGYAAPTPYFLYDQNNSVIGNTIVGLGAGGGTVNAYGVYAYYQGSNFSILNNVISPDPGNAYTYYGVFVNYGYNQNVDINGNTINVGYNANYACYGIYSYYTGALSSPTKSNTVNIKNNTIQGTLGALFSSTFYGIYSYYNYADTLNISGNNLTNLNIPGTGTAYMFYVYYWGNNLLFSNNNISNIYRASSGLIYPAYIYYSNMEYPKSWIYGNVFNNLRSVSGTISGLYHYGRPTETSYIYSNTLSNWVTGTGSYIYGLYNSNSLNAYVYRNNIFNLRDSAYTSGYVYNVFQAGGTNNYYYNNFISNSRANSSSSVTANIGIYVGGGTFTGIYFNSIYLADTSTSTSYGSAGIYLAGSYPIEVRNNNIVNISKPGNASYTAKTCGIRLGSSSYLTYYITYSNNNNIYCGSLSDTGRVIYFDGSNRDFTIQSFKNRVNPRDQSSLTEMPNFVNASAGDLHINTSMATLLNNGALTVSPPFSPISITTDIDGNTRTDPYCDIGADEFSGTTATDVVAPTIVYNTLGNGTTTNRQLTSVLILDPSGVNSTTYAPRVYYKKSINANTFNDNTSATNGWKYAVGTLSGSTFNFTIDYSRIYGGSVSVGDIIQYFVVAQDNAGTPNVGINAGVFATTPSSVALTAANFPITGTINQYSITATGLSSIVYVGTGQTYTSLTKAGGLFQAINSGVLTGNLTVIITSDLTEDGTYQLQNWSEQQAPATYKIRIQPNGTTIRNIYGWVANSNGMLRFYGVNNVTIDGSYGGSGRYLRFVNRTAGAYPTVQFYYGCTYDTLKNSIIEGLNTSTTSGVVLIGAGNTVVPQQANNYLTIQGNLIRNLSDSLTAVTPYTGICNYGSALPVLNSYNNILNNEIKNCSYYGIYMSSTGTGDGWVIKNNSIYYAPDAYTPALTTVSWYGMYIYPSYYGNGYTIDSNYIGGTQAQAGGTYMPTWGLFYGIYAGLGYNTPSTIRGNVVKNIRSTYITANTTTYMGIGAVQGWLNISGNTVGSADTAQRLQMNGSFRAISATPSYYAGAADLKVNNNVVNNIWTRSDSTIATLTGTYYRYGIVVGGYLPTQCNNNTIMNMLTWQSPGATSYNCFHMGILPNVYAPATVNNNYVYNIANLVTAAPTGAGRILVYGIQPIYMGDGSMFAGNRISKIYTSTVNASGDLVIGIYNAASYYGMTTTLANNQISMLENCGSWANVMGVADVSAVAGYCNWYYNSIVLGGTSGAGNPYNSYAYYRSPTTGVATYSNLQNNILYNMRTGGNGNHLAIGILAGTLAKTGDRFPYQLADENMQPDMNKIPPQMSKTRTGVNNRMNPTGTSPYFSSDYNLLIAPSSNLIGDWYGTLGNLAAWRTAGGVDFNSIADTVANAQASQLFRNYVTANLNIDTTQAVSILAAKRGLGIAGISNDFNGYPRNTSGPTCIGSHEFNYTLPIIPTLITPANGATNVTLPIIMKWNKTIFAAGYRIMISTDSTFGTSIVNTVVTDSLYNFTLAGSNTKYFWKVRPVYTQYGEGQYSAMWNFTTGLIGGPLTGIKYIPGDYATIQAAISDLNTWGVGAGGVTFRVAANKVDTAANLIISATGTSSNPIKFEKWGTGANPKILAGTGVSTTLDGIIILNGTDYITFDGIDLQENPNNTTQTTQMEFGYALLKPDGTNGCRYVTIKNCNIVLNKTNVNSYGIYVANHTPTSTTSLTVTDTLGTNSYNNFFNNNISNVYTGVRLAGYNDISAPYIYYDQFNYIGVGGRNIITNYGGGASTAYGIYAIYQNNIKVANDSINSTPGTTTTLYGIMMSTGSNSNVDIYNNVVSVQSSATTSSVYAIYNAMGGTATDNTVNIYNNTITNCSYDNATSGSFYYIYQSAACYNMNIYGNNIVNNVYGSNAATATGTLGYIYTLGGNVSPGSTWKIYNNNISNNSRVQSTLGAGTVYALYNSSTALTYEVYGNTIANNTWPTTSSTRYGIYASTSNPTLVNVYNNTIKNITSPGATGGTLYAMYMSTSAANVNLNIFNNSINNLSNLGSTIVYGIYATTSTTGKLRIYGDTLYTFNSDNTVRGIHTVTCDTAWVYKNKVYDLNTVSGVSYGINIGARGAAYIYNNYVSELRSTAAANTNACVGMYLSGLAGAQYYFHYNTIYLNATSSATTFGTSAIYASTTQTTELKNNIVVNVSVPGSTDGITAAYRRSDATLSTYSDSSDRNCFYAGTPSARRLIYYDGTFSDSTIAQFKARVAPRDANSFTELPPFVNVTTSPYDLHLLTNVPTLCEGNARPIIVPISITDDYDGNTRNAVTPDVGADEGNFTPVMGLSLSMKAYLEGFWNGTTHIQDTIRVYLAGSSSPYQFVDSQKVVIGTDGTANLLFTNAAGGNYYIAVKHRNHLETWSRLPQTFSPGVPVNYDFTTDSAKAYGYNMKKVGSSWVFFGGDANQDGSIDAQDALLLISQFGTQGYVSCDFNGDGDVNAADILIFVPNFGYTKVVPSLAVIIVDPKNKNVEEFFRNYQEHNGNLNLNNEQKRKNESPKLIENKDNSKKGNK